MVSSGNPTHDKDVTLSTREGRMERRPGPPVADDRKAASTDRMIKSVMAKLHDKIQSCLMQKTQAEVSVTISLYDGAITRSDVGITETEKPS